MSMYTKIGFSKPFSCCGHWQICHMGKLDCHYKEIDPESMENCRCYQRFHNMESPIVSADSTLEEQPSSLDSPPLEQKENKKTITTNEMEQLSPF